MPYTVVFFSSSEIALPLLNAIHSDSHFKISGLICQPDKPAGRGGELRPPEMKHAALKLEIPVYQPEKLSLDTELFSRFQDDLPDFFLTFAYGQLIPVSWLALPRIAPLNVHPSLLPHYRGPSPIQTALLNGDKETGVTLMKMVKEMDAGPIAGQVHYTIPEHSTSSTLFDDLGRETAGFVPDLIAKIAEDPSLWVEQNANEITMTKKIEKDDGRIDFKKSAQEIFRQFRAYTPWPGIFTTYQGKRLKLSELEPCDEVLEPGKIRCDKHNLLIGTSDGALRVKQVQLEGKNVLYVDQFMIGQAEFCSASLPS